MLSPGKTVDLHIHTYGYEDCEPLHSCGPAVREFYLFHYIFSGKGLFQSSEGTFQLQQGQGFLIFPKELTFYEADKNAPWSYAWVGVTGLHAGECFKESGLSRENPVWNGGNDNLMETCLKEICSIARTAPANSLGITGYTYLFFSRLIALSDSHKPRDHRNNRQKSYIQASIAYIEQNYHKKLTVEEVASHIGLDRSYLGTIFRKHTHTTMQAYLLQLRISKACGLLRSEDIRIADVARSVGYDDPFQFSKIFKQHKGISPLAYKKSFR